ncbi:hydrolase [Nocardia mangyaensis]|uniref:Hydrolase n=1 Tax=Nocardia mangyaensis TaxID=2213200 RepID=A0A1J0VLD3_9NOCA|nr:serine hydrolase [Nocardia mangyaensis]APE32851.1 hydrolase [Nocardia mangyaensis]
MGHSRGVFSGIVALALVSASLFAAPVHAAPRGGVECSVTSGRELERAMPEQVGLDPAKLAEALQFADSRNRLNVQVFRHNCLVGEGPRNEETGNVAWNIWSVTKSVVSLLTGIASDQGKLAIDAPIDRYLPPGLGDAAHRAITVENLLTETSGMKVGVLTEGITAVIPVDPHSAVQALAVELTNPPGTTFSYSQRNVDLLSYVIELAVGEPLQDFAQRELFGPLGIAGEDYYWARDRSGFTYGYAHLLMPPNNLAKIGLLVANDGRWGAERVISDDYLRKARTPSPQNRCYGYLFWVGADCAESPDFLPPDTFFMSGLALQNVFFMPELDLMVMWTGAFGNITEHGARGVIAHPEELPHEFFRRLFAAFTDTPVPVAEPYVEPPLEFEASKLFDAEILLAVFGIGKGAYPGCTVFNCLDQPLAPPFASIPPGCAILVCLGDDPRTPGIKTVE